MARHREDPVNNGKSTTGNRNAPPVLDQGIVITGDLVVKLMGLKLLPINVRLLITSAHVAEGMGLDWWRDNADADTPAAQPHKSKPTSRANGRRRA